jgi:hypothetical protein
MKHNGKSNWLLYIGVASAAGVLALIIKRALEKPKAEIPPPPDYFLLPNPAPLPKGSYNATLKP